MSMDYMGISYFPVDANFFEEETIELLEAKFGMKASYATLRLLSKIYKEGYYISWGKEQCLIFLRKIGGEVNEETMNETIALLLEKGFFHKESYEQHGILTSQKIQKVWLDATYRRKRDFTQLPYLLITPADLKKGNCKHKVSTNEESVDISPTQSELSPENADIFEQSKVEKSIVEKNKASSSEEGGISNASFQVPGYAYNKATHNIEGLIDSLKRHKVTDLKEQQTILRLSDYGRKETPVWKLFPNTNWNKIGSPGKYIIAALAGSGNRT